jgi:hypothetical protein
MRPQQADAVKWSWQYFTYLMIIRSFIRTFVCQPYKAVEAQLSLKAGKLGMFEVSRNNVIRKLFWFMDQEGPAMGLPRNDVGESQNVGLRQKLVKNGRKWIVHSARRLGFQFDLEWVRYADHTSIVMQIMFDMVPFVPFIGEGQLARHFLAFGCPVGTACFLSFSTICHRAMLYSEGKQKTKCVFTAVWC